MTALERYSTWELVSQPWLIVAVLVLWLLSTAIYRLYIDPLSKIPGPKLAALSSWYNAYYDLIAGGQYVWKIDEMHRKYGPIVRIRPDVVHVNDPCFMEKLYSQSPKQRRERYWTVWRTLQAPGSILATQDHDLHRRRRAVLNPYFSKQNVRRLESIINETLGTLFRRMDGWARQGTPVKIIMPYRAATKDVIQSYAFGDGEKYLEMENCNAPFFELMEPTRVCHLGTHVYWLAWTMAHLPPAIMTALIPRIGTFAAYMNGLNARIDQIRQQKRKGEGQRTIFHEIFRSDMPAEEKATKRLADEAMVLVIAGSETTASALAALTYHLLADPVLLKRLKVELEGVMPDPRQPPDPVKLDNLPFLNALIQETLRLYPGATHRQDRTAPDEDLIYESPDGKQYVIPAGRAFGMAAPLINRNKDLYDRPNEFLPDRYLENPSLQKYLFSFSRGTRQCLGINLAYQELQTFAASIFRRYSAFDPNKTEQDGPTLELYQTKAEDVAMQADYINPAPYEGSQGVRVIIRQ